MQILESFERFPLAVINIVVFAVLAQFDLVLPSSERLILFVFLYGGAIWFVSVRLYTESHGLSQLVCVVISLGAYLPVLYVMTSSPAVGLAILICALMVHFIFNFIASIVSTRTIRNEIWQFYYHFWGHIGRLIPVVILLYMVGAIIFFVLYYFIGIHIGRKEAGMLHGIVVFLCFPLMVLVGIPKLCRHGAGVLKNE